MVDRSELITVCRQIGGMMQAGVDILRITRVLRAQTDNPRLLQLYDALDHDLTMGRSLVDAMERAPDVWSPFIISLVQQGEDRNDLAGAFLSSADYLLKEGELEASTIASANEPGAEIDGAARRNEYSIQYAQAPAVVNAVVPPESLSSVVEALIGRLQSLAVSVLLFATALLLAWAVVWWSAGIGLLPLRWVFFALCLVAALLCGGAAMWLHQQVENRSSTEPPSSLSGQGSEDSANLHVTPVVHTPEGTAGSVVQTDENSSGVRAADETAAPSEVVAPEPSATPQRLALGNRPLSQDATPAALSSARTRTRQVEEDYE
ncbi:MAG TPA: type II secretion system F family protein [Abditibacteriaceae bacterium]